MSQFKRILNTPKHINVNKRDKNNFILGCKYNFNNASFARCISTKRVGFPSQSQVVIAGSGIVGNSVAYHLTQHGWNDVVILEQNKIGSGSSEFSSGVLGLFKPITTRNIIMQSIKLYSRLKEMGFDIGFKQTGSINLAQTKDRIIALKRRMAYNIPTGLQCEMIGPNEIKELHPHLKVEDLEGGVWVPDDAIANPNAICLALAKLAKQGGVQIFENCRVTEIHTKNGHVHGVETDSGFIKCEVFVNCSGIWARDLGLKCHPKVRIPSYPTEQFHVKTDQTVDENLPCIRDFDGHTYSRVWDGCLMVGWFEEDAKPAFGDTSIPKDWKKHLQYDFNHFMPLWENAVHRFPLLKNVKQPQLVNSSDSFTPDGRWILGESPEVKNYFIASGMNGNALQGSGGMGKQVAEWISGGRPTSDLLAFLPSRFLDLHNNRHYLQQRIREVVGRHYSILYPHQSEYKYARKLRCSPLYSALEERGAVFGIKMAYERALFFDTNYKFGSPNAIPPVMPHGSFYKPKFFEFMRKEYLACRERVGIIDMSSFSKIEITSPTNCVVDYLQKLCSNDINVPIGNLIHTGMQNEDGGYENDCMLVRLGENSYFMVSPTSQQTQIFNWMNRHLPADHSVNLNDVTSMYTVLNVVGPKATGLLSELSDKPVQLSPYTFKYMDIAYVSDVMVMAFTHTGEPGYSLYVPSEYALHVYDRLIRNGRDYGVQDVGVMTQRFMRIERFIPFWAEELSSAVTPFEVGCSYKVKLDKEYFIGKYALQHQKEKGVTRRLVMFYLNDFDADADVWPWGGEPLYRNNQFVGTVTSSGYGFTHNKLVCLGFVQKPEVISSNHMSINFIPEEHKIISEHFIMDKDAKYEIDIAGHRFPLTPHIYPSYVPQQRSQTEQYQSAPILSKLR